MTGLRVSEAVTLRPMDIEEGGLRIYGKRKPRTEKEMKINAEAHKKRMRIVQIPLIMRHWLVNFIFEKKLCSEHPIFPFTTTRAYQIIVKYSEKAKIQRKIHPHMFRHGFAVHYLNKTHSINSLQQLLGHTNLKTTSIYLKLTSADIQRMVDSVEW
jgi:site-specific recombinase XerD